MIDKIDKHLKDEIQSELMINLCYTKYCLSGVENYPG